MARTSMAALAAQVEALTASVAALTAQYARPATPQASGSDAPRTWATKAQRAAGEGFTCAGCGRTGLRTAPKAGSFHRTPKGDTHTVGA